MKNTWKPDLVDLILSTSIAILFPFIAQFLYFNTGALIPMILYYGMAWGINIWRRGSTGYSKLIKSDQLWPFFVNVGIILLSLVFAYIVRIEASDSSTEGIVFTALVWAPINAASEQLLWIYLFEAWDLYFTSKSAIPEKAAMKNLKSKKRTFRTIGLFLFTFYVGTIHTFFWVNFLHTAEAGSIFGILFVLFTSISGFFHIIVWRKTKNMLFTFIPHFLLNLIPIFWTHYSMLPYLINF